MSCEYCKVNSPEIQTEIDAAFSRGSVIGLDVKFLPWIGENYGLAGSYFDTRRVLILGASHYEWCEYCRESGTPRERSVTCRCVADRIVCGKMLDVRHWPIIEYAVMGDKIDNPSRRAAFWHSLAYYNYVQEMVGYFHGGGHPTAPTSQMWRDAQKPFFAVLRALEPALVIVLGYTLWRKLPLEGKSDMQPPMEVGGKKLLLCAYSGLAHFPRPIVACRVRHPAAGLGSTWYPVLSKVVELV